VHSHLCKASTRVLTQTGSNRTPPPPSEHSKVSLRRAVDAVQRCGVGWSEFRVWRSGTTCKQPATLAAKVAEESLSILPDYKPTVRPPPKRC
jgi:hypothetical protein